MSQNCALKVGAGAGGPRALWVSQQKGRKAVLYVIRLTGHGETFYKVGITFSFSARFTRLNMPYQVRTLARYNSYNAGKVWDLERRLLALVGEECPYAPARPFAGRTECFSAVEAVLRALPAEIRECSAGFHSLCLSRA